MPDPDPDPAAEWDAARRRVSDLLRSAPPADVERPVPACPDWSSRMLLAHMVGLDADVLAGDEPDDHNPAWTARQVEVRRDRSVADLLAEWDALAGDLVRHIREVDARPLGDVVIHEQDLRSALGAPGARDSAGFAAIRDRIAGRVMASVRAAGLPGLRLDGGPWTLDSGHDSGDPAVVVTADAFDLGRAVMSRRTADQIRGWVTAGDVEPYLGCFAVLGPLPETPLPE